MTIRPAPNRLLDLTINDFLALLASDAAAPGGGAVAALAGALAASLVAMVARLTLGRPRYAARQGEMADIAARADALRQALAALVDADTAAYGAVMAAYRLPKETDDERSGRTAAIQAALRRAVEVPLETAAACRELLALAGLVAARGNRNAASDAAVAAQMAQAGLLAAARNTRVNLGLIHDRSWSTGIEAQVVLLLAAGEQALAAALAAADDER